MPRPEKDRYYLGIADAVSKRGTCLRRNYGSVIVKDDKIVSTGYVGSPRGTTNCSDIGTCYREAHNIPRGTQYETCLAKDTKVLTDIGPIEIETLYNMNLPGIEVVSFDTNPQSSPYEMRQSIGIDIRRTKWCDTLLRVPIRFDYDEQYRLLYKCSAADSVITGYIDCTPDHKFLSVVQHVSLGNDPEMIILKPGFMDHIPKFDCIGDIEYKYIEAGKLKKGDRLAQATVVEPPYEIEYHDYVYDLTVPEYENFAVMYGKDIPCYTFVHNCKSVHSEANAIIHAGRDNCIGATLYLFGREATTGEIIKNADCCAMCKRMIINAGISRVVIKDYDNSVDEFNYHEVDVQKDWVERDDIIFGTIGY